MLADSRWVEEAKIKLAANYQAFALEVENLKTKEVIYFSYVYYFNNKLLNRRAAKYVSFLFGLMFK